MNQFGNSDLEVLAVSAVVMQEEVGDYIGKIDNKWFSFEPARRAWVLAVSYYGDHRESIPTEVVRAEVPQFKFNPRGGDVDGILESLQDRYLRGKLEMVYEEEVTTSEDPSQTIASVISRLQSLQASIQRDNGSILTDDIHEVVERYDYRAENKGALGLPWPWAPLQRTTNGAQLGDYIVIYARPKSQKTFILLKSLYHWVKYCRRKVLVITREMTKEQVQDRVFCLWAGIDYKRFRSGDMTPIERSAFDDVVREIKSTGCIIVESVETYGAEAAVQVAALCEQYGLEEGDVLAVDGMDWFAFESRYESLRAFSAGIKSLAVGGKVNGKKKKSLVAIVTGQGNQNFKAGDDGDAARETSGGDCLVRDCDIALKLVFNKEDKELTISIPAIREGESIKFTINAIPCSDYSLKYSDEPDLDESTKTIPAPTVKAPPKVTKMKKKPKGKKNAAENLRSEPTVKPAPTNRKRKKPKGIKHASVGINPASIIWPGEKS